MANDKHVRCEPEDPNRCQVSLKSGSQCPHLSMPGLDRCSLHMASGANLLKKEKARNYMLTKHQARMEQLADSSELKSLREEVGIARMTLESILNLCDTATDIMCQSSKISDLIVKIEKLVTSAHRLERSSGLLLDKAAVIQLAASFVDIVSEYISDSDTVNAISEKIIERILDANGSPTEE